MHHIHDITKPLMMYVAAALWCHMVRGCLGYVSNEDLVVCSTPLLAPRIGLYKASLVSLKDALIGWSASDYDTPIQLWRIQINTGYTLPSPTWRASPTWCKQKAFPLPGTAALWVFWKSKEFLAFFRGRGQSYARRHGTWNSLRIWRSSKTTNLRI